MIERSDGVVEQRVDGEVAAEGVLFRRAVDVVALDAARSAVAPSAAVGPVRPRLGSADVAPEGGDLDGLGAELDVGEPEPPADDPAVAEAPLDLVGLRRRADVEVLGPASEQQVAHTAADEEGRVAELLEPAHHLQRVGVDVAAGESML